VRHAAWYNVFLPRNYNDGQPIGTDKFLAIQQELIEQFGGLTEFNRPVFPMQGSWMGFGFLQTEDILIYGVYSEDINEARAFFDEATERWKSKEWLDQEATLVVEVTVEVLLK
jgi:hypothetical protein